MTSLYPLLFLCVGIPLSFGSISSRPQSSFLEDYIHIEIVSSSCKDVKVPLDRDCNYSSIVVNGKEHSVDHVGLNIVVLDRSTGELLLTAVLRTGDEVGVGVQLGILYTFALIHNRIVCMAIRPEGSRFMDTTWHYLKKLGAKSLPLSSLGSTFAFIGHKPQGNSSFQWLMQVQNEAGSGPSQINKYIPLPKLPAGREVVRITLISEGSKDSGIDTSDGARGKAFIYVNGEQKAIQGRGYNVVVADYVTGHVIDSKSFDTHAGIQICNNLVQFITSLPDDTVILVSVQGSAAGHTTSGQFQAMRSIGMRKVILDEDESFAMIGYKGNREVDWVQERNKYKGHGPTQLRARLLLPERTKPHSMGTMATVSSTMATPSIKKCGQPMTVPSARVVGGTNAQSGAWPWQAGLYQRGNNQYHCSAALIDSQWVVTTTQCMLQTLADRYYVILGDTNMTSAEGTEQMFNISKIIQHESYFNGAAFNNDIALIKLKRPAVLNDYVQTVCLPSQDSQVAINASCYITGWGKTSSKHRRPSVLQQGRVLTQSQVQCKMRLAKSRFATSLNITENMLCVSGLGAQDMTGGCHGDGGSPVVCRRGDTGQFILQGVISFGSPQCNINEMSTTCTRISSFIDWMKAKMNTA